MPLRFSTLYRKTKPPVEISLILGSGEECGRDSQFAFSEKLWRLLLRILYCPHKQYLLSLIISDHKEEGTVYFHVECFLHWHNRCNTDTHTRYCGGFCPFFVYINISFMFDFADF